MGVPRAHSCAGLHPADRGRTLHRSVHAELGLQRIPRHSRPYLRSPLRTRLPSRPHGGETRRHLPVEARRRGSQGRHLALHAAGAQAEERQAHLLVGRGAGLAGGSARPLAVRLRDRHVRPRPRRRRHDAQPDSRLPPSGRRAGRGSRSHRRHGRKRALRPRDHEHGGHARHGLRRLLRRHRRPRAAAT